MNPSLHISNVPVHDRVSNLRGSIWHEFKGRHNPGIFCGPKERHRIARKAIKNMIANLREILFYH